MDRLVGDENLDGDTERRETGRGRGRGSWHQNASEHQMLRRPHLAPSANQVAGSVTSHLDDIVKNSRLSADAAEFFPKSQVNVQLTQQRSSGMCIPGKHSVQSRIQMAREMPSQLHNLTQAQQLQATEALHYSDNYGPSSLGYPPVNEQKDKTGRLKDDADMGITNALQQLENRMQTLTVNPGDFDYLVPTLVDAIKPYLDQPNHFQKIVQAIVLQSINEGNFRYTGARLCTTFDGALMSKEQTSYRHILYSLCEEEVQKQALVWQKADEHTEDQQRNCHGLILFLAELVVQMEDTPAFTLGKLLVQLITVVLKNPAPNSAKHICQALKLAGRTLERDTSGSRKDMENMMRALTQLVTEGRVDSHVGRMVHNVHELRNGNWGQNLSTHAIPSGETAQSLKASQEVGEPVLYGPDGNVLSAEESQFLQDITQEGSDYHGTTDPEFEDGIDDDEDADIAAAYEDFLKQLTKAK